MRIVLLLPLLLWPTPGVAQIWDGGRRVERPVPALEPDTFQRGREVRRINRSIREGVRKGELTRREARALRAQVGAIAGPAAGPNSPLAAKGLVDAQRERGRARKTTGK